MSSSNRLVCSSKNTRFFKEQDTKGLLTRLRIKTPMKNI